MDAIGYMIRVELKKHPGTAPDESNSYLVLPPPGSGLPNWEVPEKAFDVLADAIHSTSTNFQHPVIEETSRRRVSIGDLQSLRNSLLSAKDGWRCFKVGS